MFVEQLPILFGNFASNFHPIKLEVQFHMQVKNEPYYASIEGIMPYKFIPYSSWDEGVTHWLSTLTALGRDDVILFLPSEDDIIAVLLLGNM